MVSNRCIQSRDAFDVVSEHGKRASIKQMGKGLMVASKV
jgi:hypothetical protein